MTINELATKWNTINPYSRGFLLVPVAHPLSFHIGYSNEALKCFWVLNTGKIDSPISSKAVRTQCVPVEDGKYALQFNLCYESLDELFIKLCWDLIDSSKSSSKPVDKIIEQYNSWRKLFQQMNPDYLSASNQKGLLGELLYLIKAIEVYGKKDALTAWIGPEGSDQDYNFSDKWVEVKAVSIAAENVLISSLQQLERNDTGELVIFFMDKTTSNGVSTISLPEIIEDIKCKLEDPELINIFECKLAKNGYFDKDADYYSKNRYFFAKEHHFFVADDFPKLTRSCVSPAITSAEYGLSLAMIEKYKIEG